jgi:hypothetical protein
MFGKRAKSSSRDAKWSREEDRILIHGTQKEWSTRRILGALDKLENAPLRSENGLRSRRKWLKDTDLWDEMQNEESSQRPREKRPSAMPDSSQVPASSPLMRFTSTMKSSERVDPQQATPTPNATSTGASSGNNKKGANTTDSRNGANTIVEPSLIEENSRRTPGLLKKQRSDGNQTQLNFARNKGKAAVLNPDWTGGTRTFSVARTTSNTSASTSAASKLGVEKPNGVVPDSDDNDEYLDNMPAAQFEQDDNAVADAPPIASTPEESSANPTTDSNVMQLDPSQHTRVTASPSRPDSIESPKCSVDATMADVPMRNDEFDAHHIVSDTPIARDLTSVSSSARQSEIDEAPGPSRSVHLQNTPSLQNSSREEARSSTGKLPRFGRHTVQSSLKRKQPRLYGSSVRRPDPYDLISQSSEDESTPIPPRRSRESPAATRVASEEATQSPQPDHTESFDDPAAHASSPAPLRPSKSALPTSSDSQATAIPANANIQSPSQPRPPKWTLQIPPSALDSWHKAKLHATRPHETRPAYEIFLESQFSRALLDASIHNNARETARLSKLHKRFTRAVRDVKGQRQPTRTLRYPQFYPHLDVTELARQADQEDADEEVGEGKFDDDATTVDWERDDRMVWLDGWEAEVGKGLPRGYKRLDPEDDEEEEEDEDEDEDEEDDDDVDEVDVNLETEGPRIVEVVEDAENSARSSKVGDKQRTSPFLRRGMHGFTQGGEEFEGNEGDVSEDDSERAFKQEENDPAQDDEMATIDSEEENHDDPRQTNRAAAQDPIIISSGDESSDSYSEDEDFLLEDQMMAPNHSLPERTPPTVPPPLHNDKNHSQAMSQSPSASNSPAENPAEGTVGRNRPNDVIPVNGTLVHHETISDDVDMEEAETPIPAVEPAATFSAQRRGGDLEVSEGDGADVVEDENMADEDTFITALDDGEEVHSRPDDENALGDAATTRQHASADNSEHNREPVVNGVAADGNIPTEDIRNETGKSTSKATKSSRGDFKDVPPVMQPPKPQNASNPTKRQKRRKKKQIEKAGLDNGSPPRKASVPESEAMTATPFRTPKLSDRASIHQHATQASNTHSGRRLSSSTNASASTSKKRRVQRKHERRILRKQLQEAEGLPSHPPRTRNSELPHDQRSAMNAPTPSTLQASSSFMRSSPPPHPRPSPTVLPDLPDPHQRPPLVSTPPTPKPTPKSVTKSHLEKPADEIPQDDQNRELSPSLPTIPRSGRPSNAASTRKSHNTQLNAKQSAKPNTTAHPVPPKPVLTNSNPPPKTPSGSGYPLGRIAAQIRSATAQIAAPPPRRERTPTPEITRRFLLSGARKSAKRKGKGKEEDSSDSSESSESESSESGSSSD